MKFTDILLSTQGKIRLNQQYPHMRRELKDYKTITSRKMSWFKKLQNYVF